MKGLGKKWFRLAMTMALSISLAIPAALPAYATSKAEVQDEISSLESEQAALETKLEELKKNKKDTESYIAELDAQIQDYVKKLEDVSKKIMETEGQISLTEKNLVQAKKDEGIQYDALKARIKAMYESGDESYLEMLFSSGDLKRLLNDSEYISKINQYDHELLTKLQEIRDQIAAYEEELKQKKAQQEEQKAEFESEKASVETISAQKQEELVSIGANIDNVNDNIEATIAEIEAENAILAQIVEQERIAAEEEARRQAEAAAAEEARRQAEAYAAQQAEASYEDAGEADYSDSGSEDSYYEEPAYTEPEPEPVYVSTGMVWPTGSRYISSYFGYRDSPTAGASSYHEGIDIAGSTGDTIWAAASGTVTGAGYDGGMGNYVTISHGNGISTVYMHCSALYVSAGQYVSQGEAIAAMGSTGISTGPHLHFSVVVGGSWVDPLGYVSP